MKSTGYRSIGKNASPYFDNNVKSVKVVRISSVSSRRKMTMDAVNIIPGIQNIGIISIVKFQLTIHDIDEFFAFVGVGVAQSGAGLHLHGDGLYLPALLFQPEQLPVQSEFAECVASLYQLGFFHGIPPTGSQDGAPMTPVPLRRCPFFPATHRIAPCGLPIRGCATRRRRAESPWPPGDDAPNPHGPHFPPARRQVRRAPLNPPCPCAPPRS